MAHTLLLDGDWSFVAQDLKHQAVQALPASDWGTMQIPTNWELGGLENHAGVVWFKRTFTMDELDAAQRYFLQFKGVEGNFHRPFLRAD